MRRGLDTDFLVQVEVLGHPRHAAARSKLDELLDAGDVLVLAPQVLAEFIHVVTDDRRFSHPFPIDQAIERAECWWFGDEVEHVFPDQGAVRVFFDWIVAHRLGRKRLLGATYYSNGVRSIVSTNARDFAIFGCFEIVLP
jgi:predicted nucleic acid-binding protein